jgi:hypothetical protein
MPNVQQQPQPDLDIDRGDRESPCQEDEEFFESRLDAETMEEVNGQFYGWQDSTESVHDTMLWYCTTLYLHILVHTVIS